MRKQDIHIDQSSEINTLKCEIADLKAMVSLRQEMLGIMKSMVIDQNKQISDIHKSLF